MNRMLNLLLTLNIIGIYTVNASSKKLTPQEIAARKAQERAEYKAKMEQRKKNQKDKRQQQEKLEEVRSYYDTAQTKIDKALEKNREIEEKIAALICSDQHNESCSTSFKEVRTMLLQQNADLEKNRAEFEQYKQYQLEGSLSSSR